jgi:hypothetical protein
MEQNSTTDFYDARMHSDVCTANLDIFLRNKIKFSYHYDRRTHKHRLIFEGLWRFFIFSNYDVLHKLFSLPSLYVDKPIDTTVLRSEIEDWSATVYMPHKVTSDSSEKYNWLLGTLLRAKRSTNACLRLLTNDLDLLNYDENVVGREPFRVLSLVSTNNMGSFNYLDVPVPNSNVFERYPDYLVRFFPPVERSLLPALFRYIRTFNMASSHITWHFNTIHIFIYSTKHAQLTHAFNKIAEDWRLNSPHNPGNILRKDRPCERLVILSGDTEVQELSAIGAMYPVDLDCVLKTQMFNLQVMRRKISDVKSLPKYKELKRQFDCILNEQSTIHVTPQQFSEIIKLGKLYSVYDRISKLDIKVITEFNTCVSSTQEVVSILTPLGSEIDDVPIRCQTSLNNQIVLDVCPPYSITNMNSLLDYVIMKPTSSVRKKDSDNFDRQYDDHSERVNNSLRFTDMINKSVSNYINNITSSTNLDTIKRHGHIHLLTQALVINDVWVPEKSIVIIPKPNASSEDGVLFRSINNSTIKLIGCYRALINLYKDKRGKKANVSRVNLDGQSINEAIQLMQNSEILNRNMLNDGNNVSRSRRQVLTNNNVRIPKYSVFNTYS